MDGRIAYIDLKKTFDKVPHEITMEVGTHWRIERKLDGRLSERKGNENSSKG